MTKSVSIALRAEMTGALQKLATCMKITRTDGNVYGFTTHDKQLVIDNLPYEAAASFTPTNVASNSNLDVDNLTVEAVLSSNTLTEEDLRAGRWDYAEFRIFSVNWSDLTMGDYKIRAGRFGEVQIHHQTFSVELLGLMEAYAISIGELTSPMCRASLGDERCKVVMNASPSYTVTGSIATSGSDFFTLTDSARTEPAGYFDEGVITFTSGQNIGLSYEVKAYVVGVWITKTPFAFDATNADYTMTRGCDRRFSTCCNTFNNAVNFRGEPWLRGNDKLVQVGRHQ